MTEIIINSKEELARYILTTLKNDLNVYEKRIIYKLVEIAHTKLLGEELKSAVISVGLDDCIKVTIPLLELMKDVGDNSYGKVKDTLWSLRNKTIKYEDAKVWKILGFIEKPVIKKIEKNVTFEVHKEVWLEICGFTKGDMLELRPVSLKELITAVDMKQLSAQMEKDANDKTTQDYYNSHEVQEFGNID